MYPWPSPRWSYLFCPSGWKLTPVPGNPPPPCNCTHFIVALISARWTASSAPPSHAPATGSARSACCTASGKCWTGWWMISYRSAGAIRICSWPTGFTLMCRWYALLLDFCLGSSSQGPTRCSRCFVFCQRALVFMLASSSGLAYFFIMGRLMGVWTLSP